MDEDDLKDLLRGQKSRSGRRGWRCPNETKLAAYVDRQLDGVARQSLEAHLAGCDYCLGQVSFMVQSADWTSAAEVPASMLARARNFVPRKEASATKWRWQWAAATAATACVVLLVALIAIYFHRQTGPTSNEPLIAQQERDMVAPKPTTPTIPLPRPAPTSSTQKPRVAEPSPPALRGGGRELLPTVTSPRNGAILRRGELQFRWKPLADAEYYEIRVVTAEGDPVFESKTEDTHLGVGNDVQLHAGAKYFVSVRAHLREGKTTKSRLVSFRIVE